jgi:hypothetical protein
MASYQFQESSHLDRTTYTHDIDVFNDVYVFYHDSKVPIQKDFRDFIYVKRIKLVYLKQLVFDNLESGYGGDNVIYRYIFKLTKNVRLLDCSDKIALRRAIIPDISMRTPMRTENILGCMVHQEIMYNLSNKDYNGFVLDRKSNNDDDPRNSPMEFCVNVSVLDLCVQSKIKW